ncbi:MAG: fused MFS/spermidine synthase, partial [bacterium]|nr:fused MFS/spermidine synthase [bacterium]
RNLATTGRKLGHLYSFNIVGSILGCLLASFLMMEHLGLTSSLLIASSVNILIGITCLIIDQKYFVTSDAENEPVGKTFLQKLKEVKSPFKLTFEQKIILLIFGLSGFTALAYEVLWVRMLIFWLGSTVYSFGIILAVFLACLAVGSFIAASLIDTCSENKLKILLAFLEIFIGVSAFLSMYLYAVAVKNSLDINSQFFFSYSFVGIKTGFITTFLTFFLLTIPFGIIFPLVIKILAGNKGKVCGYLGLGYAINTLGAVFGSLLTGLFLIPLLGVQKSISLVACVNVIICYCVVLLIQKEKGKLYKALLLPVLVLLIAGMQIIVPGDFLKKVIGSKIPGEIIHLKEGRDSTIIVIADKEGIPNLWIDGLETAGPMESMKWIAHVPMLLSSKPRKTLVIGFGSGLTMGTITKMYGVKADCVELSESVIEVGEAFSEWNHDVLHSPLANIILMDGRNFIDYTKNKYDVIIVDGGHPYLNSCSSLFSKEFYAACAKILKDDGFMVQFVPRAISSRADHDIMVQTFAFVFDYSFRIPMLSDDFVFGTKKTFLIEEQRIKGKVSANPLLTKDLASLGIPDTTMLLQYLNSFQLIERMSPSDTKIITDDSPFIEFTIARYLREGSSTPAGIPANDP